MEGLRGFIIIAIVVFVVIIIIIYFLHFSKGSPHIYLFKTLLNWEGSDASCLALDVSKW